MTKPRTMSNIDWEAPTSFHTWRNRQKQLLPPPDRGGGEDADDEAEEEATAASAEAGRGREAVEPRAAVGRWKK